MDIHLSEHAKTELMRRQISVELAMQVAQEPDQIVPARNGLECRQSKFYAESPDKEYLLRVVVNPKIAPNVIVTVYKTSKVAKYWRFEDES